MSNNVTATAPQPSADLPNPASAPQPLAGLRVVGFHNMVMGPTCVLGLASPRT